MSEFRVGITGDVLGSGGEPIFGREVLGLLDAAGIAWEFMAQEPGGVTPAQAARYDAICAMLTRVTAASLAGPDRRLKLIARFGVGYDTIDVPACTRGRRAADDRARRRAPPGRHVGADLRADAGARRCSSRTGSPATGRWSEKLDHIGTGLTGRTLGSIGLGNIGAELFRLARPLEMNGHRPRPGRRPGARRGARRAPGRPRDAVSRVGLPRGELPAQRRDPRPRQRRACSA